MTDTSSIDVRRFGSRAELQAALVERLAQALADPRGPPDAAGAAIMLSGGTTPIPAYRELAARSPAAAPGLRLLFSDDRYVPSAANASNFHQSLPLITALRLPEDSVLRVRTELPLELAADDYERRIDALVSAGVRFSFGLLGLGADGHTASLFNDGDIRKASGQRAIAVDRPDRMQAVSVTPEVIGRFEDLVFVVAGADKHDAVQALLKGDPRIAATRAIASRKQTQLWLAEV